MTSITWAGPRYVQELGTFLGPENRTQRRCEVEWGQEEEAWDQEECSPKEKDKVEWDHFHQSSFMSDER